MFETKIEEMVLRRILAFGPGLNFLSREGKAVR